MAKPSDEKQIDLKSEINKCFVLPENVEDEARITEIECYKPTTARVILFYTLAIVTAGVFLLLCKWFPSLIISVKYVRTSPTEAKAYMIHAADGTQEHIVSKTKKLCLQNETKLYKIFLYRLYTFYFDESDAKYKAVQFKIKDKTYEQVHEQMSIGVQSQQLYDERILTYGRNSTNVPTKGNLQIIIDEILSPFYLFQIFAILFWGFFNDYAIYAIAIFIISLITLCFEFYNIKMNHLKLKKRAKYETEIKVYRNFSNKSKVEAIMVSSIQLVPGDLVEIPSNKKLPCDIILLAGLCVVNESMLTGESIPIIKQQLPKISKIFDVHTADLHLLYSGTECLEVRTPNINTPALGVVVRTGFDTMKGRLVRSFVYSKPENFKFYRDSFKYVLAMGVVAILCFVVSIRSFIDQGMSRGEIINKALDILTCAVPPALPTCLAVGTAAASARLEKQKIMTKSELKINIAGRIQTMCFDKTGTLTKDSLDLYGLRYIVRKNPITSKFEPLVSEETHKTLNAGDQKLLRHKMLELMATCHALTYVKGVISGDPLDLRMFEATGWKLVEIGGTENQESCLCTIKPPSSANDKDNYYNENSEIKVIKRFEFNPKLQRMSTIIKDPKEGCQRLYVKGSPEVISSICNPETIPEDFAKTLLNYTMSGLRVIACATTQLTKNIQVEDDIERETFENNLEFLGFLIFENKLKEVTPSIIAKLKEANISTLMLTGDNPLTAIFVAKECGIVNNYQRVVLGTLKAGDPDKKIREIEWKIIEGSLDEDNQNNFTKKKSQKNFPDNSVGIEIPAKTVTVQPDQSSAPTSQIELIKMILEDDHIAVAMTGEVSKYLDPAYGLDPQFRKMLLQKGKVYARMRPDDKAYIIDKLQAQGVMVGMCGDGANDCPALKVANVGVSLSEAEASLAAPFTSRITDISCIDILLREGRTALVTSFQCFKYMSIYALIQTFNVAVLYYRASGLTNLEFLYQDIYVVLPIALTMGLVKPTEKLSKKRPTENLLSARILTGMFGQCVLQAVPQIIMAVVVSKQSWYIDPSTFYDAEVALTGDEEADPADFDKSTVFLVAAFQLTATVLAFSSGKPFRKPFYTNIPFTLWIIISGISTLIIILVSIPNIIDFIGMLDFPEQSFRWIIFAIAIISFFLTIIYEIFIVPAIFKFFKRFNKKNKYKKQTAKLQA